nr:hypothetical protein [Mucilaginibacter sp. SP1R1]
MFLLKNINTLYYSILLSTLIKVNVNSVKRCAINFDEYLLLNSYTH